MIQFIEDRNTAACCVVYASFAEILGRDDAECSERSPSAAASPSMAVSIEFPYLCLKNFLHVNPREPLPPAGDYPGGRYAGGGV